MLSTAAPANQYFGAPKGHHLAAAQFTITGVSGHVSDDSNEDAELQGSDGQLYSASFNEVAAGTNFSSGQFTVSPGSSEVGWVSFSVPDGVTPTEIQWNPQPFSNGSPSTWKL